MAIHVIQRAIILARRTWNPKKFDELFDSSVLESMSEAQRQFEDERKRSKGKGRGVGNMRRRS